MDKPITKTKRVTGAVLATVLATGMVPAAALAAPVDVQTDEGIEALVADKAAYFTSGNVASLTIGSNTVNVADNTLSIAETDIKNKTIGGATVKLAQGAGTVEIKNTTTPSVTEIAEASASPTTAYTYKYYDTKAHAEGGLPATGGVVVADLAANHTYYLRITATNVGDNPYENGYIIVEVKVTSASLEGATLVNLFDNVTATAAVVTAPTNPGTSADGVYTVTSTVSNPTNTTFVYTGNPINFAIYLNGQNLTNIPAQQVSNVTGPDAAIESLPYNWEDTNNYATTGANTIKFKKANGDGKPLTFDSGESTPTEVGDYIAVVTGAGTYAGSTVEIPFTIEPLDLSKATIVMTEPVKGDGVSIASINGVDYSNYDLTTALDVKTSSASISEPGPYSATITPTKDAGENVIGSAKVNFNVVKSQATINYVTGGITTVLNQVDIATDLSDKTTDYFDPTKIVAEYPNPAGGDTIDIANSDITVKVTDEDGNVQADPTAALKTPGKWIVTATVNAADLEYAAGGSDSCTVDVISGTVLGDSSIYVSYKSQAQYTDTVSADYTGSDILGDISIVVNDSKGNTLKEGTDYTLTVKNPKGEVVTEIVDADANNYTIEVTSDKYQINNGRINVKVNPASVVNVRIANEAIRYTTTTTTPGAAGAAPTTTTNYNVYIPATGEAITPALEFAVPNNGKDDWVALPADAYVATIKYTDKEGQTPNKVVSEIKEPGYYSITISPTKDATNYTINASTPVKIDSGNPAQVFTAIDEDNTVAPPKPAVPATYSTTIHVSDAQLFPDVPNGEWYTDYIYTACENGYMTGELGSGLFGTNGNLTRAQACIVLYNMAGGTVYSSGFQDKVHNYNGYAANYSDLEKDEYYMVAISWADTMGLIKGYPDGTFGPNDKVTREQFVTMIQRYAKLLNKDTSVDAAKVLGEYKDGASVAEWFADPVAWAAQEEIIGQNTDGYLWSGDTITRAQAAKMVVTYQPEKLPKPLV